MNERLFRACMGIALAAIAAFVWWLSGFNFNERGSHAAVVATTVFISFGYGFFVLGELYE